MATVALLPIGVVLYGHFQLPLAHKCAGQSDVLISIKDVLLEGPSGSKVQLHCSHCVDVERCGVRCTYVLSPSMVMFSTYLINVSGLPFSIVREVLDVLAP